MKKFTTCLLIITMLISTLSLYGCTPVNDPLDKEVLDERYTELLDVLNASDDVSDVSSHLMKWANENDIPVSYDSYGNVIMSSKSTEGYSNAESNIFQCTIDLENKEQTAAGMTVASYIISHTQNHGFVRILFTSPGGLQKLSRTYIAANNFISLDCNEENALLVGSAGNDYYTMSTRLKWEKPSYTDAYQIVIEGLPETDFRESQKAPNPITIIGEILAKAKSSSILLELAELNGGTSANTLPTSVTCTILVNQKDANNVKKRVQSAMDDFYEKYDVDPETFTFTYSEVEAPSYVISYEDTARIISFLYTCPDGIYLKDDAGEVIAKANIGSFHTDNIGFTANVAVASKSSDVLNEMETVFETVCGLSNISYTKTSGEPVWETVAADKQSYSEENILTGEDAEENNSLVHSLTTAFSDVTGRKPKLVRTFDSTPCATAHKRVSYMHIAGFGVSEDNIQEAAEIIIKYLENGNLSAE